MSPHCFPRVVAVVGLGGDRSRAAGAVEHHRSPAEKSGQCRSQRAAAFQEVQQALEQAKSLTNAVAMSTALSLALRRYLAIALGDPSLFETHEEFLARHDALASLPESIRHSLSEHFSTLCRYKYAPCEETVDLSLLVPQASTLLHQIHAVEPRPAPAAP